MIASAQAYSYFKLFVVTLNLSLLGFIYKEEYKRFLCLYRKSKKKKNHGVGIRVPNHNRSYVSIIVGDHRC